MSEIILQQTRVDQGLPYYLKFIEAFPTVFDLAEASEEQVLKLWQGLGYYSRARNLHKTAKHVVAKLDGVFPSTFDELLKLKGVGDYTASAIASICFDGNHAVVDGNVYRVLSRVFGIGTPINSTDGFKEFKALAQELLDTQDPGTHNQALMEFGAKQCVPQSPDCASCIFNDKCVANQSKKVNELPVKLKNAKIKKHYYNYIVPLTEKHESLLLKRTNKGIWQNLYEFPLVETQTQVDESQLLQERKFQQLSKEWDIASLSLYNEEQIIHKLSHKHLYTRFWIAEARTLNEPTLSYGEIHELPVPKLIASFISEFSHFNN